MERCSGGGDDEWPSQAMKDSSLAADVLVHLRTALAPTAVPRRRTPDLVAGTSSAPPAQEASDPFEWGARAKRSRFFIEDEEETPAARRTRDSPMTPLDFSGASGSSDCGGEEGPSAARSGGAADPAAGSSGTGGREGKAPAAGGPGPSVFKIPDQKPIRRLMKKQSVAELQSIHRSLLEERDRLRNEIEEQMKMEEELRGENFRLKKIMLSAKLQSPLSETAAFPEEEQPKQLQSSRAFLALPDLNIPLLQESD